MSKKRNPDIDKILNDPKKLHKVAVTVFQAVDTDKSGFISKDELAVALKQLTNDVEIPEPDEEMINECYSGLDANGDGQLSLDEFTVLVKTLLDILAES